jgi:CMP/dCMP kinase
MTSPPFKKAGRRPVVAIDGPAGAGKSTVTQRVAGALGYTRVDTGALYRAVALIASERGIDLSNGPAVGAVASDLAQPSAVELSTSGDQVTVRVEGRDVTEALRSREASLGASIVSQAPEVRSALLALQRQLGSGGGVVLEGRDIGTVVFPDAEAKFYLTASTKVRAERRQAELAQKGEAPPLAEIMAEVADRDRRDTERPVAPLVQAPDAIVVDSSDMTIDEVVEAIVRHVKGLES